VVAELAAEVVQVIAVAAQDPESVPQPDQATAFLERPSSLTAQAAAPLQQAAGTQTALPDAADRAIDANGTAEATHAQMAGSPVCTNRGPAALLSPNTEQEAGAGKLASAAEGKSRLPSLQPKAIPSLCLGQQRSDGLFRQAPVRAPVFDPAAMRAVPRLTQQPEANFPAASAIKAALQDAGPGAEQSSAAALSTAQPRAVSAQAGIGRSPAAGPPTVGMTEAGAGQPSLQPTAQGAKVQGLAGPKPTALGTMFGASKRAGPTAKPGITSNAQKAASPEDKVCGHAHCPGAAAANHCCKCSKTNDRWSCPVICPIR
jgi:hypothetical protein